jgi:hypothetical protein
MNTMTDQSQQADKLRTMSMPSLLLHVEGLTVLVAVIILYAHLGGSALLFVVLLFVPDVSMIGYMKNPQLGSAIYNMVHTYVAPAILMLVSLMAGSALGIQIALIWFAHIGMDRTMGFGLKYAAEFKATHFGRV